MKSKREEAAVGLFVLIAVALLIGIVLAKSGTFSSGAVPHYTYFKSAGGLQAGAKVRYGGMDAGKVKSVRVDPADSTRIEIDFDVEAGIPVKKDSIAKTAALGALGGNYLELGTGTKDSALAPPGSELKSTETMGLAELGEAIGNMAPLTKEVLQNLDQRLIELQVTLQRANDLLNDKNRAAVSSSLGNVDSILSDTRPKLATTMTNVQAASARLQPALDNLQTTTNHANEVLSHIDSVMVENHDDIRTIVVKLKDLLVTASSLTEQLKNATDNNEDNIDQIVLNIRAVTENTKELTDELKNNPSLIIRGRNVKDRTPGEPLK